MAEKRVFKSPRNQARSALKGRLALGQSRHQNKKTGDLFSLGTLRTYEDALAQVVKWQRNEMDDWRGLLALVHDEPPHVAKEMAEIYLMWRAELVHQKQLNKDRQALCKALGREDLIRPQSELDEIELVTRSYWQEQVEEITKHQSAGNALATRIALAAGLRAHELITLRKSDELQPSTHRKWRGDLFVGRHGEPYAVVGKGGLIRAVVVPDHLAEELEKVRLTEVRLVEDRRIRYAKQYDIGGGQAWSQSFSDASQRCLGWSNGAHGLRHTYAQERMREVQSHGYGERDAQKIVSQELGHFRPEILSFYYR